MIEPASIKIISRIANTLLEPWKVFSKTNSTAFIILQILAVVIAFSAIVISEINTRKLPRFFPKENFYKTMLQAKGSLDANSYRLIFESYNRRYEEAVGKYGYLELLGDYVVFLIDNQKDEAALSEAKRLYDKLIEVNPFQSLPIEERLVLQRLHQQIEILPKNEDMKNSLRDLQSIMQLRNSESNQAKLESRLGLIFGVLGVFLTLIGLVQAIYLYRRQRATENLAPAIRAQLSESSKKPKVEKRGGNN